MSESVSTTARPKLSYHFDGLMAGMMCGASLDVVTTYYVLSRRLGVEANPVAAPLFRHSLAWIPVYLLLRPLLVALLPKIPRVAFAWFYLLMGLSAGLNNLGGILFQHYFLVAWFGIWGLGAFWFFVVIALILYAFRKWRGHQDALDQIKIGLRFVGLFFVLEGAFLGLGCWLHQ